MNYQLTHNKVIYILLVLIFVTEHQSYQNTLILHDVYQMFVLEFVNVFLLYPMEMLLKKNLIIITV